MKMMTALAVAAAAGMAASANAGVLFSSDFEAPAYATGPLAGQNGWTAGAIPGGSVGANFVGNVINNPANAFAGSQYMEVNSVNWSGDTTASTYRLAYAYQGNSGPAIGAGDIALNPILHVSVALRMNTPSGTRGGFSTINAYSSATPFGLGAMGIAWTGAGLSSAGPFSTANTSYLYLSNTDPGGAGHAFVFSGSSATSWLNTWLQVDMYFNYTTGLISYNINGSSLDAQLDTAGFNRAFSTVPAQYFSQADLQSERDRPLAGASSGGATMRYDNYLVELIPAPSTAALLGLGGLVAARRRRS